MTLTQTAVARLRKEIINGTITTDEGLTERVLCERFEMSRSPIRMAMQILTGEGLLSYSENCGYRLVPITSAQVIATYDVRAILEGLACRLLVLNQPSAKVLEGLHREVEIGDQIIASYCKAFDDGLWSGMNERFHGLITESAGNTPLVQALKQVKGSAFSEFSSTLIIPKAELLDLMKSAQDMHRRIVAAIARGEALRAEGLMHEHIFAARDVIIDQLAKRSAD